MKKGFIKNIILIAVLLVLTVLTGCGAGNGKETASAPASREGTETASGQASRGETDMGGYEIRLAWENANFVYGSSTRPLSKQSPYYEEEVQQIKDIENKYNCKIKFKGVPDIHIKFPTWAASGDDQADAVSIKTFWTMPYQTKGYCLALEDYIDITLPFWKKELLRFHNYKGHYYGVPYPYAHMDVPFQSIFFNKDIFEKQALPNLYELQKNKEWTWDKALEIARAATKDTNGDGKIDQWGWGEGFWGAGVGLADQLLASNGAAYAEYNSSTGKVEFALDTPAALEALNWAFDMVNVHKVVVSYLDPGGGGYGNFVDKGRIAMMSLYSWIGEETKMKRTKFSWGQVAFPRGPRMDDVVNAIHSTYSYIMPTVSKHPDWTGKIITALCEPQEWRNPITLYESISNDKDDIESLKYMAERSVYTWQEMIPSFYTLHGGFNFSGIHFLMYGPDYTKEQPNQTPASYAASVKGKVQAEIDGLFKDYTKDELDVLFGIKE